MAKFIPLETEETFIPLEEESSGGFVSLSDQPVELDFSHLSGIVEPDLPNYGAIADPSSPEGDIAGRSAQQFPARSLPTESELKQIGSEAKAVVPAVGKGIVRGAERIQ